MASLLRSGAHGIVAIGWTGAHGLRHGAAFVRGYLKRQGFSIAMKKSSGSSTPIGLELDLCTSAADVAALRRVPNRPVSELTTYFRFLRSFPPPSPERLRTRRGPSGAPFRL